MDDHEFFFDETRHSPNSEGVKCYVTTLSRMTRWGDVGVKNCVTSFIDDHLFVFHPICPIDSDRFDCEGCVWKIFPFLLDQTECLEKGFWSKRVGNKLGRMIFFPEIVSRNGKKIFLILRPKIRELLILNSILFALFIKQIFIAKCRWNLGQFNESSVKAI